MKHGVSADEGGGGEKRKKVLGHGGKFLKRKRKRHASSSLHDNQEALMSKQAVQSQALRDKNSTTRMLIVDL